MGNPLEIPVNGAPNLSQEEQAQNLIKPYAKEEVKNAVFEMQRFKAPGLDGIQAGFYQKMWGVVGDTLSTDSFQISLKKVHSQ